VESIAAAGKNYRLVSNYKLDDELRNKFNLLAQKVWGFDFEKWYKSGYWEDNCLLYSLLHDDKMVSHITVSVIEFIVLGERKKFVQLGTVMTDENYRKQGLNKIFMEENVVILQDILSIQYVEIDEVIQSLATDKTKEAIMRCMPIQSENYEISPHSGTKSSVCSARASPICPFFPDPP
jgi:hypothetical protein